MENGCSRAAKGESPSVSQTNWPQRKRKPSCPSGSSTSVTESPGSGRTSRTVQGRRRSASGLKSRTRRISPTQPSVQASQSQRTTGRERSRPASSACQMPSSTAAAASGPWLQRQAS